MYDNYQRAKATKIYNCHKPQKQASIVYQFIPINLVEFINFVDFREKKYLFRFTDDFMQYTKIYIRVQKSDWFIYLKTFYNFCQTRL